MKLRTYGCSLLAATLLSLTAVAADKVHTPKTGDDLVKAVRHEILMYPRYTLWDDISFRIDNGNVTLLGDVTQPYKKSDLQNLVKHVSGVETVSNDLKVLPLSPEDDRLRIQVARAIFRDPNLSRYAMGAIPSIHIIVDNGHVMLTGEVASNMDKQIAGMRASGAGLSFGPVVNNLTIHS
jgi:hyperosmotically inducible protein